MFEKYFPPFIAVAAFSLFGLTIPKMSQMKTADPNANPPVITPLTNPFL